MSRLIFSIASPWPPPKKPVANVPVGAAAAGIGAGATGTAGAAVWNGACSGRAAARCGSGAWEFGGASAGKRTKIPRATSTM